MILITQFKVDCRNLILDFEVISLAGFPPKPEQYQIKFLGNCPDDLDIPGIPQIQLPQRRFGVYHSSCPDMAAVIGILEKEIGTAPSQTSPSSKDATSGQGRGLLRWNLRRELGREVEKFSV